MFLRTTNRKGISTVLVTLIILVASVVLGTGVVLYGTSMFQNQANSASLASTNIQVWVNATDTNNVAWGVVDMRNTGDKILSMDKIIVRGQQIPYANWYVDTDNTRATSANWLAVSTYNKTDSTGMIKNSANSGGSWAQGTGNACPSGTNILIDLDGAGGSKPGLCLNRQSGPISLKPGALGIVYFRVPNSVLTTIDTGSSADVGFYAGQVGAPSSIVVQAK